MSTNKKQNSCGHHSVYLVTYTQVDLLKYWIHETFAEMVTGEFDKAEKVCEHWVSSCKNHKGEGLHFHLALKLKKVRRWKYVRDQLPLKVLHQRTFFKNFIPIHMTQSDMWLKKTKIIQFFTTHRQLRKQLWADAWFRLAAVHKLLLIT